MEAEFIVDFATIASLMDSDEEDESEILATLVNLFIVNTPKRIENMLRAIEEKDFKRVSREAHTLRSNCGNLGLLSMASTCRKLEEMEGSGLVVSARSVGAFVREVELEFLEAKEILLGFLPDESVETTEL